MAERVCAKTKDKAIHRVSPAVKPDKEFDMKDVISRMPKVGYFDSEGYTVLPKDYDDDDDDYADVRVDIIKEEWSVRTACANKERLNELL
jgi:hypothetical protein